MKTANMNNWRAKVIVRLGKRLRWIGGWWLVEARRVLSHLGWEQQRLLFASDTTEEGISFHLVSSSGRRLASGAIQRRDWSFGRIKEVLKLAHSDITSFPVGIVMPETAVFSRIVEIPREAISRLDDIFSAEMVRRTPFSPDQVFVRMDVVDHPAEKKKRIIRQRIVRKDLVAKKCLELSLDFDNVNFISISPQTMSDADAIWLAEMPLYSKWRRVIAVFAAIGLGLTALNVGILWWKQETAITALENQLPDERRKALNVRRMLEEIKVKQNFIGTMLNRTSTPMMLDTWSEISRILPDSSWLTEVHLRDDRLTMVGYSLNAAALVPLFSDTKQLTDVALSSPIVAQDGMPLEHFTIAAKIARNSDITVSPR